MGETEFRERVSLLEESEFLRFALEKCPGAIFVIGPDSMFHYVNKAAEDSLGYSQDELLNMGVPDIDPWYNGDDWLQHFKDVKKEGSQRIETRHRRKDRTLIAVEVYTNYFIFGDDEFLCAFANDITGRVENSENLAEIAARYEYLFNAYPQPVLVINDDGMILGANPSVCKMLGYDFTKMVGKFVTEFMCTDSRQHFENMFDLVLKEDDVMCEINYCCSNGSEQKTMCSPIVVVDDHEDIKSVMLFFQKV